MDCGKWACGLTDAVARDSVIATVMPCSEPTLPPTGSTTVVFLYSLQHNLLFNMQICGIYHRKSFFIYILVLCQFVMT